MKKVFFAAFVGIICICNSCTSDTATTSSKNTEEEQKNLAANDVIMKAFQTGDVSGIDSVVADDFMDHTDRGDMKGRDSLKSMVKWMHTNMKEMKMEKKLEVAEGDYVWTRMNYTGNSDGSMGMPQGPYDMDAIELSKYKDGKAVEHWAFMEMQDAMKMMMPPAQQPGNKMDTSMKK